MPVDEAASPREEVESQVVRLERRAAERAFAGRAIAGGGDVMEATVQLQRGVSVQFNVAPSATRVEEMHEVIVDSVTDNSAIVTVRSTPQTLMLKIGESKLLDLDADGLNDLQVLLKSVNVGAGSAEVVLTSLYSPPVAEKKSSSSSIVLVAVVVLIVLVALVLVVRARRSKEKPVRK